MFESVCQHGFHLPDCMAAEQLHIPDEDDEDLCVGEFEDMMVSRSESGGSRAIMQHRRQQSRTPSFPTQDDEDIDIVDDGSGQDAETNKFDRIVGALEGE